MRQSNSCTERGCPMSEADDPAVKSSRNGKYQVRLCACLTISPTVSSLRTWNGPTACQRSRDRTFHHLVDAPSYSMTKSEHKGAMDLSRSLHPTDNAVTTGYDPVGGNTLGRSSFLEPFLRSEAQAEHFDATITTIVSTQTSVRSKPRGQWLVACIRFVNTSEYACAGQREVRTM